MNRPYRQPLVCCLLLASVSQAYALGLGGIRTQSHLGERLHAEIALIGGAEARLDSSCFALVEPYQDRGLPVLRQGSLSLRGNRLVLDSYQSMHEPAIQIAIRVGCNYELRREYTLNLSPGIDAPGTAGISAPLPRQTVEQASAGDYNPPVPARRKLPPKTAPVTPVPATSALPPATSPTGIPALPALPGSPPAASSPATGMAPTLPGQQPASPPGSPVPPVPAQPGQPAPAAAQPPGAAGTAPAPLPPQGMAGMTGQPPAEPGGSPAPATTPAPAASPAAPKTPPAPAPEPELSPEEEIMRFIDDNLPLVAAGLLIVLLLILFGVRKWQAQRKLSRLSVVKNPRREPVAKAPGGISAYSSLPAKDAALAAGSKASVVPSFVPSMEIQSQFSVSGQTVNEHFEANPVLELAEIMLSFGRVDGAAQALREFVESNPTEALQPWIKLMEVYRMAGMREQFEEVARNLNRNFNVEVQSWEQANAQGHSGIDLDLNLEATGKPAISNAGKMQSLEDVPRIRDYLIKTWGTQDCMSYLQQLLRDNRDGKRLGFPLPVVEEILLLVDVLETRMQAEGGIL